MPYGYCGNILHVDLSTGKIHIEQPDETFYRRYMGGKGFAGYYMHHMIPDGADPLGPENVLVFSTGVVGGSGGPGLNRYTVAAKSPLTGGWGESEAGGYWGPELKFASFDAVVIKGRADKPVYLWIHDGQAEIRSAEHIWGLNTAECQAVIRENLGDARVRVAQIGPGGENLVRYACVVNELRHFNGRGGMGAVMGSKNLKALAVRGHKKVAVHDQETLVRLSREFARQVLEQPSTATMQKQGTPGLTAGQNAAGMLPTNNFQMGTFDGVAEIDYGAFAKIETGIGTCHACPVRCKREVTVKDPRFSLDPGYGGPEYETIGAFGSNCGVADIAAVAKANELCSRYTIDTISTGMAISFAMECFENGILTLEDTGGLELRFGNAEAMLAMVEKIARRQGLGNLLAEGAKNAAAKIGQGSEKFVLAVKGQDFAMHEPRAKYMVAIGAAICDTGADHLMSPMDASFHLQESVALQRIAPLGVIEPVELFDLSAKKVRLYCYTEAVFTLWKVLGVCNFPWAPRTWQPMENFVDMFEAITGWDTSMWELLKVSERAAAMSRMFNIRCGIDRKDDWLPERFFEPLEKAKIKGEGLPAEDLRKAIDMVFEMKGWDPATSRPTDTKLRELELDWLIEDGE